MNSHSKALDKAKKHAHKRGADGKCTICNMVMKGGKDLDDKGNAPHKELGAKNNDSEED